MKQTTLKKLKGSKKTNPVSQLSARDYSENRLTPIALSGVIAPWTESLTCGRISDYKLVTYSGLEYFIVSNDEWRDVLSKYCWEDVKVIGLLNIANMTLIPQKVFPKGPTGENIIDMDHRKRTEFIKAFAKKINDFVVIPAAVWAIMAA